MDPAQLLTKMFGTSGRVLVKDGEFNQVDGRYERYDNSQHTTNIGSNNMIGNSLHNVHNSSPQTTYHGRNVPSNHHNRRSATHRVATTDASAMNNHALQVPASAELVYGTNTPQSHAPIQGLVCSSSFTVGVKIPGQHAHTQPGDIRPMMAPELEFMKRQMAWMAQEMDNEFGAEDEDQDVDVSSEDELQSEMRSPSLTTNFQRLTIDERVSPSARSAPVHISSPNTLKAEQSSRHVIEGNIVEVDNTRHEYNFNSRRVANNIVENSFGEREQEVTEQTSRLRKSRQSHVPKGQNRLDRS